MSMDTKTPTTELPEETAQEREKLLAALKPADRELIEQTLAQTPGLTAAEAIWHCEEMGGLSLSGTGLRETLGMPEDED
jgi:hypothetical protein